MLFPPILNSSQVPFNANSILYTIYFQLPSMLSNESLKNSKINIKITKQSNNKSIVRNSSGIIEKNYLNNNDYVTISTENDVYPWEPGSLYKVQMRFFLNKEYSEWSNVMIIKAITVPTPVIVNSVSAGGQDSIITTQKIFSSSTPSITGSCVFGQGEKEVIDKFRFILYDDLGNIIETSGWLQHNASEDGVDIYRFKTYLINKQNYKVQYEIISNNGYQASSKIEDYRVEISQLNALKNITLHTVNDSDFCKENACIQVMLKSTDKFSGNYVLSRTSEKSDFTIWEDIKYFLFDNKHFEDGEVIYNDFIIENGVQYQYAFQYENSAGFRSSPIYESIEPKKSIDFEYNYLYYNGLQLKLKFNNKISSFKHTVLASKSDTIGSKYPTIFRNGHAYYAEFPITGLISVNMDLEQTFFTLKDSGYYYQDELVIPARKIPEEFYYIRNDISSPKRLMAQEITNLNEDNIYIEKIFRDKVEEFLNDGKYKLFKSATEGNMIIALTNVSMTPNASLGRMIYEFSATAYEIAECIPENLDLYNIINIGEFSEFSEEDIYITGQISGLIKGNQTQFLINKNEHKIYWEGLPIKNILDDIKESVSYDIGGGYRYDFLELSSIAFERYPIIDFKEEILELNAKISELNQKEDKTKKDNEELIRLQELKKYYELIKEVNQEETSNPVITINFDNKQIVVGKNKVYHVKDVFTDLNSIILEYSAPIILNYVAKVRRIENIADTIQAIETAASWGQIAGIFTSDKKVLNNYNHNYENYDYEIPSFRYIKKGNDIIFEDDYNNTAYNLYKTENILDIIKAETKKQVEKNYNTNFDIEEENNTWTDGIWHYQFNDIDNVSIEADKGTILIIRDELGERFVTIGPSERYTLNPSTNLIDSLTFKDSVFAIIDYKCTSNQTKKGIGGN